MIAKLSVTSSKIDYTVNNFLSKTMGLSHMHAVVVEYHTTVTISIIIIYTGYSIKILDYLRQH